MTDRIYAANRDSDPPSIDVIDGRSNTFISSIPLGETPQWLAVDPVRDRIFVATSSPVVAVIDGRTEQVLKRITVGGNSHVAVDRVHRRAYVTNEELSGTVGVIDTRSLQVIDNIAVGPNPFDVAVDMHSDRIFVTDLGSDTAEPNLDSLLVAIDGGTDTVAASLSMQPFVLAVNPITRRVYVVDPFSATVVVISEK